MGRQPGKLGNAHRTRCAYDCFSRMWVRVSYHRQNICRSVFKTNVMGRGGTRQRLKNKGYGKSAFRLTRGTGLTMSWEARPLHQCIKTFGSQTNSLTPFVSISEPKNNPMKSQTQWSNLRQFPPTCFTYEHKLCILATLPNAPLSLGLLHVPFCVKGPNHHPSC